jgi:predicted amidohydrolase
MPRKVMVVTTSWGANGVTLGLEAEAIKERTLQTALDLLDEAAALQPDLVCLPEELLIIGVPREHRRVLLEPARGPAFRALAERARRHGTYVVAGLGEERGGRRYNTAVLIDRQGELVGQYDKVQPTDYEIAAGVTPGGGLPVFETDFGKVGIQICYDIGWPAGWDELGGQGAEVVVWPSAYDGGFPLQAYAWRNQYYVVSSVWTSFGRVIDITGRVLGQTTRSARLVAQEIVQYSDENYFTMESHDAAWPVARIAREWEMETFREYHARATCVQDQAREAAARDMSTVSE